MNDERTVRLERWNGPWSDDDPDAKFKAEIALYANVDPMTTIDNLAANVHVPAGAIVRYVLARWASGGSGGILEMGPSMINRLRRGCGGGAGGGRGRRPGGAAAAAAASAKGGRR